MSVISDLLSGETIAGLRAKLIAYAQAAELKITNWITGSTGEQILAAVSEMAFGQSRSVTLMVRGFVSLDTSTDPGDPDDFDEDNEALTPAAGMLSHLGENVHGTERGAETFANGDVTFDNTLGVVPRTFAPGSLVFTWTAVSPPDPTPTYRNASDDSIYTNPDGTVTVAAGDTLDIPVEAEESGTRSNAPAGALSLTTTLIGVTATNAEPIVGTDREDAELYRVRCRQASARTSLAGAADIYEYLSTKTIDGEPLENASGNEVAITRIWVTDESAVGAIDMYFADDSGAASAEDVDAANLNVQTYALATPGCITWGPGVDGGIAAVEVPITVVGTGKIRSRPGVDDATLKADAEDAMEAAVAAFINTTPIGGMDQTLGAGVLYTTDLRAAADAYDGLYNVQVTTPAAASTALVQGRVPTVASVAFTVTVVP